ncbi:cell division protein FtsK [Pseudonocardia sp. KRD-184]|uniref:Cell division protein FtsK n=1 Tax=Pseudonocardia oceani TaxID=2792013 RepID=A0ABS6U7L6_9PSEU|nr:FtsK/SpoIIIE domain-containing protein [Pseudonocardia oceani]MBW0088985.1 cell division protein FtsK [Pseudonocardia oceani]MBW0095710.1 cell division protein FtsK [Pseudonocardia oceani]MBW0108545.1 cell division protein FtsK [Pseudonocardia oceani]MBW0121904.1 cell division protein FtsK [Pseudonocardia oceani]MBW0128210.1 cell division protein FtsK [Pseudonocardia oceani]
MNTAQIVVVALVAGGGLWVLHKVGRWLTQLLEALAAIAVVFVTLWLIVKGVWWAGRQVVKHWRTSVSTAVAAAWCYLLGWPSLAITAAVIGLGLVGWWQLGRDSFEPWAGRHLRAWWLRWVLYARKMPGWLRACGLTVADRDPGVHVQVNPFRRSAVQPKVKPGAGRTPRVVGVRSGGSWDEVRVQLVPGQTPEDFDLAARSLAVARGVARCQVRELGPNLVSIDFQRHDRLASVVPCHYLGNLTWVRGEHVDFRRVWSGRSEYGTDWFQAIEGSHTLVAGSTGAGKNSFTWAPIISMAPAIRDGLVRVSGIDPKGMELAYGRRVFHRYASTSKDALALLDDLIDGMTARKEQFSTHKRVVPISHEHPLELVEFDEIGALVRYVGDRKTREAIVERVALLTTQGRALGYSVRGYVQEPTKDTVPVRELFPRRICLRVASKSHVSMVLGEHAYDRGAWANRIGEHEPGIGYLFGEGIREPLRVRSAWVPDHVIKDLEHFVHSPASPPLANPAQGGPFAAPVPALQPIGGQA